MLRVHLTAGDLPRTGFASQPAPLIEVGHALAALQRLDPAFDRWRRFSAARLPAEARQLLDLVPPTLLQDAWPRVCQSYRAEVAWRGRLIAELGVQAALGTLHPRISWKGPVLQIEAAAEMDLRPGGAAMTLLPSLLWTGRPMVGKHTDGSVLIVYPARTPLPLIDEVGNDPLAGRPRGVLPGQWRVTAVTRYPVVFSLSSAAI